MTGQQLQVVHPATGELLDLAGQPTGQLADLLAGCRDYQQQVADFREQVEREICDRMDMELDRTAQAGGWKITVNAAARDEWDLDRLAVVLAELIDRNVISEAAALKVIGQPPPKPQPKVLRRQALNVLVKDATPETKALIAECASPVAQRRTVKIERLS